MLVWRSQRGDSHMKRKGKLSAEPRLPRRRLQAAPHCSGRFHGVRQQLKSWRLQVQVTENGLFFSTKVGGGGVALLSCGKLSNKMHQTPYQSQVPVSSSKPRETPRVMDPPSRSAAPRAIVASENGDLQHLQRHAIYQRGIAWYTVLGIDFLTQSHCKLPTAL